MSDTPSSLDTLFDISGEGKVEEEEELDDQTFTTDEPDD